MSELIPSKKNFRETARWQLLSGTSALVLIAYLASPAIAEESDRPTLWIELGGQLNRLEESQEAFAPPFVALTPSIFPSPLEAERSARYGLDESASLTIQPRGSDWVFSAAIRYGRSSTNRHVHHQTYPGLYYKYHSPNGAPIYSGIPAIAARFTDAKVQRTETHAVLDFQAGKDVGVGLFGHDATATLDVGVRFAQFTSRSLIKLKEDPDWHFSNKPFFFSYHNSYFSFANTYAVVFQPYHSFEGMLQAQRSFTGLGPSISWKSSVPFAGSPQSAQLSFDWGVNGALLFGRQKARTHHQTTGRYHPPGSGISPNTSAYLITVYRHPATPDHTRSRNVVVPNIGAFAGLSFRYDSGYRADFFFGAMDGGIDTRETFDRNFYGPFATISIGLGG